MMEISQAIQIAKLIGLMGGSVLIWFIWQKYNFVRTSVGWKFINSMAKTKKGIGGTDLVLRIKSPAGKETYSYVKHSPFIEYKFFEKGKDAKKYVIYDERAVDYLNGIPILNVTPIDIRPIDRETGLLVNIPSEIIDKLAVDSSKTAEGQQMKDKQMKMLLYTIAIMGVLFIVAVSYINQTNAELQKEIARCAIDLGKSVTVIAGQ